MIIYMFYIQHAPKYRLFWQCRCSISITLGLWYIHKVGMFNFMHPTKNVCMFSIAWNTRQINVSSHRQFAIIHHIATHHNDVVSGFLIVLHDSFPVYIQQQSAQHRSISQSLVEPCVSEVLAQYCLYPLHGLRLFPVQLSSLVGDDAGVKSSTVCRNAPEPLEHMNARLRSTKLHTKKETIEIWGNSNFPQIIFMCQKTFRKAQVDNRQYLLLIKYITFIKS